MLKNGAARLCSVPFVVGCEENKHIYVKRRTYTFRFIEREQRHRHFIGLSIGEIYRYCMRKAYFTATISHAILSVKNKGLTKTLYLYYNFKMYG